MGNYYKPTNETIKLAKSGNKQAIEEIIIGNLPYIEKIISCEYKNISMDTREDLKQVAIFGVYDAIRCYKPETNLEFGNYLKIRIKARCNRYLDKDNIVTIPIRLKQTLVKYKKLISNNATDEEIYNETKINAGELNTLGTTVQTLNYVDAMKLESTLSLEEEFEESEKIKHLYECLDKLDPDEKSILCLKFGLINGEEHTNHIICRKTGIKKKEIEELCNEALIKLKKIMEEKY